MTNNESHAEIFIFLDTQKTHVPKNKYFHQGPKPLHPSFLNFLKDFLQWPRRAILEESA